MSRRTNTTNLTCFTLPFPSAVTFDFSSSSPTSEISSPNTPIHITISPSSSWRMPLHWHPSEKPGASTHETATVPGCESVTCRSGYLLICTLTGIRGDSTMAGYKGLSEKFTAGQRVLWGRVPALSPDQEDPDDLAVDLVTDHTLWRNVCSATLDMGLYPKLASTPWWLKALFAILARIAPSRRDALLKRMLWMQLQTMFFAHDFQTEHGNVPVTWLWTAQPFGGRAPDWARNLDLQSELLIAKMMTTMIYWTGMIFLGMEGRHVEYTPSGRWNGDQKHGNKYPVV